MVIGTTTKLLFASMAGLGALIVAARVTPDHGDTAGAATGVIAAAPRPAASATQRGATADKPAGTTAGNDALLALAQRERSIPDTAGDAFARHHWQPPPPPPPPAPPPPPPPPPPAAPVVAAPPAPPPVPFNFVGMLEQGADKPQAYLAKGDTLFVVSAGDVIENHTYRVESLSPHAVVLTFLPSGRPQTLNVQGGAK